MSKPSVSYTASLICHSADPSAVVKGIEVYVDHRSDGALGLVYKMRGNISRLRIPKSRPPQRADRLWEHTCLEAFIGAKDGECYHEFNFSPSGEWGSYRFLSYRHGAHIADEQLDPRIVVRKGSELLELRADIDLTRLESIREDTRLVVGLAAVIEESAGCLSYWALKHPPGKPDFHHRDNFMLEFFPPGERRLKSLK